MSNLDACVAADTPVDDFTVYLQTFFTFTTFVISLPQNYKLWSLKSSKGLSLTTVVLTLVMNFTDVAAGIITKWQQIEACRHGWSCYPGIVDLIQLTALMLTTIVILLQVVWYPPHTECVDRTAASCTLFATAAALTVSTILSIYSGCSSAAIDLARVFGTTSDVSAVIQYAPQLLETVRHESSGSLSITMYLVQVAGGLAIVALQAFGSSDPWPVWLPILTSTLMQLAVALIALYYDLRLRGLQVTQPSEHLAVGLLASGARSQPPQQQPAPPPSAVG